MFRKHPIETQNEVFHMLINKGKYTQFGSDHRFENINLSNTNKALKQFKTQVPIRNYEAIKPYIKRAIKGEEDVLWPGETRWFAKSSGTTASKSKFIPVTTEALEDCHYKGGKDLLSIYFNYFEDSKLFTGKSVAIGGSSQINQFNPNSYYGDLSSIIIENLPYWANFHKTPDKDIVLHPNFETKIEKMARLTAIQNVTNLAGVPSWNLIFLKRILEQQNKQNILEVWPNLELYVHGGVAFDSYKTQYESIMPSQQVTYLETYNASEGFFGIRDQFNGQNDMLLMLDYGVFYEFIPLENINDQHPKTLQLNDVEIGKNYALVISTNGGLWRYKIGDTVTFTSLNPFRIKLTGRTKYFINIFGEELIEDNTKQALTQACKLCNAQVKEYTVAPIFANENGQGGHEWIIEFSKAPTNKKEFTNALDNALKQANSDYEAKRYKNMALKLPVVHFAKPNTFYSWLKTKNKLGGQNKVPRLSNKRNVLEELLTLNQ